MDYPLLNVFWTMLWFFAFALWICVLVFVIADIFRRRDLSGWGKTGWLAAVILLPLLGVFTYTIIYGQEMGERTYQEAQRRDSLQQGFGPSAVRATQGTADELAKLADLRRQGDISEAEFEQGKRRILT
ncbi:hypothetical protein CcI49_22050 [Frankia sp. CcI49]|uniref:SHOCT domain-containing protein n=1 Tax=unclassified Frankia TaxID=2632575 RepID=UPI0006CA5185|nr:MULTISPECIES: SHOCT domain-containing protein [unclassified Frankia]KPM56320.1 membrane protein [Frankia sp. R43]ONH58407.1 hypothetical protein CcI49_22050 [Frankia sp. CcI49]